MMTLVTNNHIKLRKTLPIIYIVVNGIDTRKHILICFQLTCIGFFFSIPHD